MIPCALTSFRHIVASCANACRVTCSHVILDREAQNGLNASTSPDDTQARATAHLQRVFQSLRSDRIYEAAERDTAAFSHSTRDSRAGAEDARTCTSKRADSHNRREARSCNSKCQPRVQPQYVSELGQCGAAAPPSGPSSKCSSYTRADVHEPPAARETLSPGSSATVKSGCELPAVPSEAAYGKRGETDVNTRTQKHTTEGRHGPPHQSSWPRLRSRNRRGRRACLRKVCIPVKDQ